MGKKEILKRSLIFIALSITFNLLLFIYKFISGLIGDKFLLVSSSINLINSITKIICFQGIKKNINNKEVTFKVHKIIKEDLIDKRNVSHYNLLNGIISILIIIFSIVYIGYSIFTLNHYQVNNFNEINSLIMALISFIEIVISIFGLFSFKGKGHIYRDLKIVNFITSLTSILVASKGLLIVYSPNSSSNEIEDYISYGGIVLGIIIFIIGLMLIFAPYYSFEDPKIINYSKDIKLIKNDYFILNSSINENNEYYEGSINLKNNKIYGSIIFFYVIKIEDNQINLRGYISLKKHQKVKNKKIRIVINVLGVCIFPLTLIYLLLYSLGNLIFFLTSLNKNKKLKTLLLSNHYLVK